MPVTFNSCHDNVSNAKNGQPYCRVNFSGPPIPTEVPVVWNTSTLPQAANLDITRQDDDW